MTARAPFGKAQKPFGNTEKPFGNAKKAIWKNGFFDSFRYRPASTRNALVEEIFASTRASLVNGIGWIYRIGYII